MSRAQVITLILIACLGGLLWWTLEPYDYVKALPSNVDRNWANDELLAQNGTSSEYSHSISKLFPLPDADTVLIFRKAKGKLASEQLAQIKHWVADGGTLVIEPYRHLDYLEACLSDSLDDDEGNPEENGIDENFEENFEDHIAENENTECDPSDAETVLSEILDDDEFKTAQDYEKADALSYTFGVTAWEFDPEDNVVRTPPFPGSQRQQRFLSLFDFTCDEVDDRDKERCLTFRCGNPDQIMPISEGMIWGQHFRIGLTPNTDIIHYDLYDWSGEDPEAYPESPVTDSRITGGLQNSEKYQALALSHGNGRVLFISDLDIWENNRLHQLDHAALLLHIAANKDRIIWLKDVSMPPVSNWLWANAWQVIVSLLLLLVAAIAYAMPRRSTLLDDQHYNQHDFLEHLRASSYFLWQRKEKDHLLSPLRTELCRLLERQGALKDNASRAAIAAELTGYDAEQIKIALSVSPEDASSLINTVRLLQAVLQKLKFRH